MSFKKVGEFRETKYNDTIHEVFDADLQFGAQLHRFINGGASPCSAIYSGDEQVWWTYRDGEADMIDDWQKLDRAITKEWKVHA